MKKKRRYKPRNKGKVTKVLSESWNKTVDRYKDLSEFIREEKQRGGNSEGKVFDLTQFEYNGKYEF